MTKNQFVSIMRLQLSTFSDCVGLDNNIMKFTKLDKSDSKCYYNQLNIGISIVWLDSFQLSIVKLPDESSGKISPKVKVRVNLVLAVKGLSNVCLNVFIVPFLSIIVNWNSGFPMDGKSMTVALLICVPSTERTNGKDTVRGLP